MARFRNLTAERRPRVVEVVALLFIIAALFGLLVMQVRATTGADTELVAAQRRGVAYLRPLTRLVVDLGRAQSAAVRGAAVDGLAVTGAVAAVAEAERTHGAALHTESRWADLRAGIETVAAQGPRGAAALERYGDLLALALDLFRQVGDAAKLLGDPRLDTYYLMDAVLLRLPATVVAAGLAADRAFLAPTGAGGRLDVEVAVQRDRVAAAADAIGTGLRKALDQKAQGASGQALTEPLDAFGSAADQVVPPAALRQAPAAPTAGALAAAANQVRESARALSAAVLAELDALLAQRERRLSYQRAYTLGVAATAVTVAVVLLWWCTPPPRTRRDEPGPDGTTLPPDVASVSVELPTVDARELLAMEELVHVGRGVRAHPTSEADDAR